jgi:diacylglycerol kinase (ATP)
VKTCIIVNPNAGSAAQFEDLRAALEERDDTVYWQTADTGHAAELAARAVHDGYEVIAAAGGDGTINEVVNGILGAGGEAALGVIPLGTGNDLARLLGIAGSPHDAAGLLHVGEMKRLDAFRVDTNGRTLYGINAAAGGFSGQVDEVLTDELKASWGPLAYLIGAATVLPDLTKYETFVAYDDGPIEQIRALNIIIANGRTIGGGRRVSPLSNPEDGLLDVVIVESGNVVQLGEVAARLMAGNYLNSAKVLHRQARKITVDSRPGMWFNVDGELLTKDPLTFQVLPGALRVIVGTDYKAEPENG